jgi:hypothetical protein
MAHYRPIDLLNVVLLLVELEDEQGRLLDAIAARPIITSRCGCACGERLGRSAKPLLSIG